MALVGLPMTESNSMSSILVIDDDPAAARLLQLALTRAGHSVDVARDIASGKRAAGSRPHDLLILEAFLPDGSGLDLVGAVRTELHSAVPALLLTGQRQEGFMVRAEAAGVTGYLTKPFNLLELLAEVDRLTVRAARLTG